MMQRIIATLFALAALLQRSTHAPRPISWLLVRLLRRVEPMIRHFVLCTGWEAGAIAVVLPDPPSMQEESRTAAMRLAYCFHAFAAALESLPRQLYERWRACEALQLAPRQLAFQLGRVQRCATCSFDQPAPPLIDSS